MRYFLPLIFLSTMLTAHANAECRDTPPVPTASSVDLKRYLGTWYEIASIPAFFQRGCVATKATYSPLENSNELKVENSCRKENLDGPLKTATGRARLPDESVTSKLQVSFVWPYWFAWGDYWIVAVADDYRYAIVGHPCRSYGWILSRTPHMTDADKKQAEEILKNAGYDISQFQWTPQP